MHTSAPPCPPQHGLALPVCIDCRHVGKAILTNLARQCLHPAAALTRDLVTGAVTGPRCSDERLPEGGCGVAGTRFEPSDAAQREAACTNKVKARRPYASCIEWVPLCEVEDWRDISDSTNRSKASACSGCAFSPNSR